MNDLFSAIASPFFNSISTIFKAQAVKELSPLIVASVGALLGSGILFFILFLRRTKIDLEKLRANYKQIIMLTILRPLAGELLLVTGLFFTSGIKAIFFTKTEPYFVLFWFWLFRKEKIKPSYLVLLAIHLAGAIVLSTGGNFGINKPQIGDLFIVMAMGFFSLSYFFSKDLSQKVGAQLTNAVTLGIAGIVLMPLIFIISPTITSSFPASGWVNLLVYVILFNVIALTLWFSSLKSVPGWLVSALRALGPIFGAPIAYFFFHETLNGIQIIGGIVVLGTSFLMAREHIKSA